MPQVNSCIQLLEGHYTFIKVASKGLFLCLTGLTAAEKLSVQRWLPPTQTTN